MRALAAVACLLLCSCASTAAERKVLTVRSLQAKCALVAFSACAPLTTPAQR